MICFYGASGRRHLSLGVSNAPALAGAFDFSLRPLQMTDAFVEGANCGIPQR
jgi:hypothetical protein